MVFVVISCLLVLDGLIITQPLGFVKGESTPISDQFLTNFQSHRKSTIQNRQPADLVGDETAFGALNA